MVDSVAWWIAHGSLSRVIQTVFHLGLVSLSRYLTALKLGLATSFCLLYIHSFLLFSCLADAQFADCITCLYHTENFISVWMYNCIFFQFINKLVVSLCFSHPLTHSLLMALTQISIHLSAHFHVCFSLLLLPHKIHTTQCRLHPSVTSIDVKEVHTHAASSLPSIIPETHRLTYLLDRQGKHVWLTFRQLPIKADWGNAPLMLKYLARKSFLKKDRNTDRFASPQGFLPH